MHTCLVKHLTRLIMKTSLFLYGKKAKFPKLSVSKNVNKQLI